MGRDSLIVWQEIDGLRGNRKILCLNVTKRVIRSLGFFGWNGSPYIDLLCGIDESIRIIEYRLWTVWLLRSEVIYSSWNTRVDGERPGDKVRVVARIKHDPENIR